MPLFDASASNNKLDDKNQRTSSLVTIFLRSARYEGRHLLHHGWDFLLLLWLPLIAMLSVWWTFSNPRISEIPIGIIDHNKSNYSRTLSRYLDTSPDLAVYKTYHDTVKVQNDILERKIYGVVIIPDDFSKQINQGSPSPVVLKVNAQYGTHSGIVQRGVQSVVGTFSAGAEMIRSVKQGTATEVAKTTYSPIGIERISLFNISSNYQQFLASTAISALLHILTMIIGTTVVGRELRDRTLSVWYDSITHPSFDYPDFAALKYIPPDERLAHIYQSYPNYYLQQQQKLINSNELNNVNRTATTDDSDSITSQSSDENIQNTQNHTGGLNNIDGGTKQRAIPYTPNHMSIMALVAGLNGKLIWGLIFYMLWGALMILLSVQTHPASLQGMLMVWMAFVALTMISFWLGAIFSLLSYSLRMGLSTAAFISAPSFAFAGVTFPLLAMSDGAQRWANALPLTHYLKVHINQLQMLAPISFALPTLIGLIVAVMVSLVIASLLTIRAFKHPLRWGAR